MEFRLLGPLDIREGGRELRLVPPKQRALLALLLLRRGEPVPVDRIAEELWAGNPPTTAAKAVRVYVGQVRKALGAEVVVTHAGGYALPLDGHETDIGQFERLAADGRARLEAEDADGAASALREALALWRGPALADFAYESFAQPEITRLEEARAAAVEARIDAELSLGRAVELVPELQQLVAEHPLRERLRGQLMLALYRSGRQADALGAYREGRRQLVEELGLEPGRALQELERAILAHDTTIGSARGRGADPPAQRKRCAALLVAGGALIAAAAAAAVAIALTRSGEGGISSVVAGNSLAAVDPRTGRIVEEVPVGSTPTAVAVGQGAVWVLNADDQTISRVDLQTKMVRTFGIGATPTDVAAGSSGVWVGNGGKLTHAQFAGTTATALTRLDPHTGAVRATIPLPRTGSARSNVAQSHIAVAEGGVWAIGPDYSLARIDPAANAVTAVSRDLPAVAVASDGRALWVLGGDGTIGRVAPSGRRLTARTRVPAAGLSALAVGGGSVWATDPYQGILWRIDPGAQVVQRTIDIGAGADTVAFGAGAVWVANSVQGTLTQVDPATDRVVRRIELGNTPRAVAVGAGRVWVVVAGEGVLRAARVRADQGARALPATICGPLVSGSSRPRFIVASDLPLRGGSRFPTLEMSAAIVDVFRRHAFRAGRYSVGYQSCDDSTAQTGLYDVGKCAANAKAYAANPLVVGVIGPYNSGCAYPQIPIAGRAGLAILSPTNSDVGLTRAAYGAPRGALRALYPTGRRTYARLMSPDDAQAAADALLARRLGAKKVFVLEDGGYGAGLAVYFGRAAKRLGVRVVGRVRWDPRRPRAPALAALVARSRAQAVFLCGLIDTNAGPVLKALRRALPSTVPIIGCDGLLPAALLFERAGPAARGTYVSIDGLAKERLGTVGKTFLRELEQTQQGARVDVAAVYAGQAAELLLHAISSSDGTRSSISSQLRRARVHEGLLGSFAFDENGDPTPTPVTIVRLQRGGAATAVQSYEGARVDSVISPPRRLLWKGG